MLFQQTILKKQMLAGSEKIRKAYKAELAKQKITLSLKQQDEWEEYFNEYQTECRNFVNQITTTDKEINTNIPILLNLMQRLINGLKQMLKKKSKNNRITEKYCQKLIDDIENKTVNNETPSSQKIT